MWLVVFRLVAKLKGGEPCPYALSWITDNPIRRWYMRDALSWIGIRAGERVLELGPGPGAFTIPAAELVGAEGRLVAVDIQPKMIAAVEARVEQAGLTNVETHVASAYELPLADGSIDRAFLITVLPEVPDRQRALAELHRVLRSPDPSNGQSGGMLSVTEEFMDPDYPLARTTVRWVEEAGFELEERHGSFWLYTLNFRKTVPG